jgi:hypothetical protein
MSFEGGSGSGTGSSNSKGGDKKSSSNSKGSDGKSSSSGKGGIGSSVGKGGDGSSNSKGGASSSTGKGGTGSSTGKGGTESTNNSSRNSYSSSSGYVFDDPLKALAMQLYEGLISRHGSSSKSTTSSGMDKETVEDLIHAFNSPESRWAWMLAVAAMFQRAVLPDLMYLEQTQGTFLLQLLYQVLLEDRGLGGQGIGKGADGAMALSASRDDVNVEECLAAISGAGVDAVVDQLRNDGQMVEVEVHSLVLLVLQCMLYEPPQADREALRKLQPSKLMLVDCGKGLY